ncbi:unnamed protein product [Linum trigynum]|uniref:Uncharacterized protein n=1 Tax=Linum trigynum TaxID=586398 RepID=A0AAV2EUF6_9ROSI
MLVFDRFGKIWFTEGNYVTRRFVFDSNSTSKLRALASGGGGGQSQNRGGKQSSFREWRWCLTSDGNQAWRPPNFSPEGRRGLQSWWRREPVGDDRPTTVRGHDRDGGLVGDRLDRRVGAGELPELAGLLGDYVRSLQTEEGFEAKMNCGASSSGAFSSASGERLRTNSINSLLNGSTNWEH